MTTTPISETARATSRPMILSEPELVRPAGGRSKDEFMCDEVSCPLDDIDGSRRQRPLHIH